LEVEIFQKTDAQELEKKAKRIYNKYLFDQSPHEINIEWKVKETIVTMMQNQLFTASMFDAAQSSVRDLMETDCVPPFSRTEECNTIPSKKKGFVNNLADFMKVKHNTLKPTSLRKENSVDVMDLYFDGTERESKILSIPPTHSAPVAFAHSQPISISAPRNVSSSAPQHTFGSPDSDCFDQALVGSPNKLNGSPLSWSQPISLNSSSLSENEPLTSNNSRGPPMVRRHNSFSLGPGDNIRSWVKHMKPQKTHNAK